MKTISLRLLFFILVITLFSCKKEDANPVNQTAIEPPSTISHEHYTGNFLVDITDNYSYSGLGYISRHQAYNKVIHLYSQNDTLYFGSQGLPIDSANQTLFTEPFDIENPETVFEIEFSNDFNEVSIISEWGDGNISPSSNITYNGERTELLETTSPHPYLQDQIGEYLLEKTYWDSELGIETVQLDTFYVAIDGTTIHIGDESYTLPSRFHNHIYSQHDFASDGFDPFNETISLDWSDNFSFDRFYIETPYGEESDSTSVIYIGDAI